MTSTLIVFSGLASVVAGAMPAVAVAQAPTKPVTEWVTMKDPVEDCFTVKLPKGWMSQAYVNRAFDVHREVVVTVSPNSDTVIFMGDPNGFSYWAPETATPMHYELAKINPFMKIESYPNEYPYFTKHMEKKFGKLPKFKIGGITKNEKVEDSLRRVFSARGWNGRCAAMDLTFTFEDKGKTSKVLIVGTMIDFGPFWMMDYWGIASTQDPEKFRDNLYEIANSKKTNPAWTAKQQQLHAARMAQIEEFGRMLTQRHEQNMAWIQQSAQRHQTRMQAMWAASDASVKGFFERSAASDGQHQRFLNYINDEYTVTNSSGKTFQVDHSYQRYYVKKGTSQYMGGDINFGEDALRKLGMNPDDWEEVQIKR